MVFQKEKLGVKPVFWDTMSIIYEETPCIKLIIDYKTVDVKFLNITTYNFSILTIFFFNFIC